MAAKRGETKEQCYFCEDIFHRNREQGLPEEESVVYEDDYIYVMPDISPLIVGHMLIISKKHCQGYANAGEETIRSVEKFLLYYEKRLGSANYTIFEHGAVVSYGAGSSIDHAHIHIIPTEIKIRKKLRSLFPETAILDLQELEQFGNVEQPYLYCKMGTELIGFAYPVDTIKSQFLREMANEFLIKKHSYSWKETYRQKESFIEFYKTLNWWESLTYPVPFKWKKKMLLVKYGLAEYKDLIRETNRFRVGEEERMIKLMAMELECRKNIQCRIIPMPREHQYKLPNYVVSKESDLDQVRAFLKAQGDHQEIWYYVMGDTEKNDVYSGRISYLWRAGTSYEYIEMVHGDSPREIERYTTTGGTRCVRAYKHLGEYHLEYTKEQESACQAFEQLKQSLTIYQEKLRQFRVVMGAFGIYSLSLDFKLDGKQITFINWDTSDDKEILRYINT